MQDRPASFASGPGPSFIATRHALTDAAQRTAALLRGGTDPTARVPRLTWTVGETAAHLAAEARHYTGILTGDTDVDGYLALAPDGATAAERSALLNARQLRDSTERDLGALAEAIVTDVERFVAAADLRSPDEAILTGNGLRMTVSTMTAVLLGEQLVHGFDIARAWRARWQISRADALRVISAVMTMLPDYVDPTAASGVQVAYELRFRRGPAYRVTFDDGSATVEPAGGKVDCKIHADPTAFLLVGYGRIGQWHQAVRGRILAGGRKPWVALRFSQLLAAV